MPPKNFEQNTIFELFLQCGKYIKEFCIILSMKFIRNFIALICFPAVLAGIYSLIESFAIFSAQGGNYMPFWIGVLCYFVFQIAFFKPLRAYIFGHELSHAIAGVLSGAKIKKFKVGQESGSVTLTKDNLWITLAPYMFPMYTLIILGFYYGLSFATDMKPFYSYFLFLMGFSISFHIALTIYILGIEQPDLKVYGKFFSYMVILAVNVLVFAGLFALIFPEAMKISELFDKISANIVSIYIFIWTGAKKVWAAFQ